MQAASACRRIDRQPRGRPEKSQFRGHALRACKNIDHHADAEPHQKLYTLYIYIIYICVRWCARRGHKTAVEWPVGRRQLETAARNKGQIDLTARAATARLLAFCACPQCIRTYAAADGVLDPAATFAMHFLFFRQPLYIYTNWTCWWGRGRREKLCFATRGWRRWRTSHYFFFKPSGILTNILIGDGFHYSSMFAMRFIIKIIF